MDCFSRLKEAEAHSASRDASAEEDCPTRERAAGGPLLYGANHSYPKPRLNSLTIASGRWRVRSANCRQAQQRWLPPACLAVAARHAVLTLSRARSNMVARRPALSRSIRHHRSRTMPAAAARGGGFMAGALQTAAGVAGGVVLGNMLTNMFSGSHPQEIVNIIEEPQPDAASAQDSIAQDTTAGDDPFRRETISSLPTIPERRLRRRLWRR